MKINVPIRKVEDYQADDGRKIEVYTKIGEAETEFKDSENLEEQMSFSEDEVVYMGVLQIQLIDAIRDISFPIEDVNSVNEAFVKFNELAPDFIKQVHATLKAEQSKVRPVSESEAQGIIVPGS